MRQIDKASAYALLVMLIVLAALYFLSFLAPPQHLLVKPTSPVAGATKRCLATGGRPTRGTCLYRYHQESYSAE